MPKPTEHDLDRFVQQNVLCCLSSLVATLASDTSMRPGELAVLCEQAMELTSPVEDYEEAALQAGFRPRTYGGFIDHHGNLHETAQEACEANNLDPYAREVFEHWAISDWFADQLIAEGERVDKDFAGLCVWGRTTTGQAISMDGVITRIWNEIHKDL